MRSKLRRCEKLAREHNMFVKPKVNRVAAILDKISDDMNRIMDYLLRPEESFDGGRVSRVGWAIECCSSQLSDSRIIGPIISVEFEGSGSKDYSITEVSEILWNESFD